MFRYEIENKEHYDRLESIKDINEVVEILNNEKMDEEEREDYLALMWFLSTWNVVSAYDVDASDDNDRWRFEGICDITDEGEFVYGEVESPLCDAYIVPVDPILVPWINEKAHAVAMLEFVLMFKDGEFWGLGLNSGSDYFVRNKVIPLYGVHEKDHGWDLDEPSAGGFEEAWEMLCEMQGR